MGIPTFLTLRHEITVPVYGALYSFVQNPAPGELYPFAGGTYNDAGVIAQAPYWQDASEVYFGSHKLFRPNGDGTTFETFYTGFFGVAYPTSVPGTSRDAWSIWGNQAVYGTTYFDGVGFTNNYYLADLSVSTGTLNGQPWHEAVWLQGSAAGYDNNKHPPFPIRFPTYNDLSWCIDFMTDGSAAQLATLPLSVNDFSPSPVGIPEFPGGFGFAAWPDGVFDNFIYYGNLFSHTTPQIARVGRADPTIQINYDLSVNPAGPVTQAEFKSASSRVKTVKDGFLVVLPNFRAMVIDPENMLFDLYTFSPQDKAAVAALGDGPSWNGFYASIVLTHDGFAMVQAFDAPLRMVATNALPTTTIPKIRLTVGTVCCSPNAQGIS